MGVCCIDEMEVVFFILKSFCVFVVYGDGFFIFRCNVFKLNVRFFKFVFDEMFGNICIVRNYFL